MIEVYFGQTVYVNYRKIRQIMLELVVK